MNNQFLIRLFELIETGEDNRILQLIEENKKTSISIDDIIAFSRESGCLIKEQLHGSVNINGSGGSGIIKPNLSSVTAMYVACVSDVRVVKTGSCAYTGKWGSTDFFRELGLLNSENRKRVLEKYGFAYYDYLEVSPWKRYKKAMYSNTDLNALFWKVVFFDYPASTYFLGISVPRYHASLNQLWLENRPENLITFYTATTDRVIDEITPGKVFLQTEKFIDIPGNIPVLSNSNELRSINYKLINGEEEGVWKDCVSECCSIVLLKLHVTSSLEEGKELFDKAWKDRMLLKMLKEVKT